jgi:hypothetical protein
MAVLACPAVLRAFVEEVVPYCCGLDFWVLCGVDVLLDDSSGDGYLVGKSPLSSRVVGFGRQK